MMYSSGDGTFDYLNIESIIDPAKVREVCSSTKMKDWDKISEVKQFPGKISKKVIPIDFSYYRMGIITKVEAGVFVDTHLHEEPIFRYVMHGDLILNDMVHNPGDWVLVPSNTPYKVSTNSGYTAFVEYGAKCGSPQDRVVKRREKA